MSDMRRAHRALVVGLRMAEIDHFVDRQKPSVERSWARALQPHTHRLLLKRLTTEGTERLRLRFDEQELASGAGLMRVREAIVACKATRTGAAATARAQSTAPLFAVLRAAFASASSRKRLESASDAFAPEVDALMRRVHGITDLWRC